MYSTLRPRLRICTQRSTSSVYMKIALVEQADRLEVGAADHHAGAADPGTSRADAAQLVHLADDAADLAVIEAREDLLLEFVPRRDRRRPTTAPESRARSAAARRRSPRPDATPGRAPASGSRRAAPPCRDSAAARSRCAWRGCRGCWPSRSRGCRRTRSPARPASARRTCAAVPSVDALSTTVMVVGNGSVWPTSDCRHASISVVEL